MKNITKVCICAIPLLCATSFASNGQLKDEKDKLSYTVGVNIAKNLQTQKIDVNIDSLIAGIKDQQKNDKLAMTEDEMRQTVTDFQAQSVKRLESEKKALAEKNLADGMRFLEENKKKKDVVTLASGLQYRVIKAGSGARPKAEDTVTVHYVGKLLDGTEFDGSRKRGEPSKFSPSAVIPGWTEALQLMQPGSEWELVIPANLAYGERGAGELIGPNATLIFDVELLSIDKPAKTSTKTKNALKIKG